jgi:hypothetical protein
MRLNQHTTSLQSRVTLLELAIRMIVVLNVIDATCTAWWVRAGWATEANPLMAQVLELGLMPFMLTKLALGMSAAFFLHTHRNLPLARFGIVGALIVYSLVGAIHLRQGAQQWNSGQLLALASD